MKKIILLNLLLLFIGTAKTQVTNPGISSVFNDSIVPKIYITINPDSLAYIYANVNADIEFRSTFVFKSITINDTLNNVGFSLRGNTSLQAHKKSFKLSFNTFNSGRSFRGLEKMNLNGEHNDPSIIRSKLCWDLLRATVSPASRTNHVDVYINGTYYGLYMNVEHIDENFLDKRFDNNNGNLYKCTYPADLAYLGANPDLYKLTNSMGRVYELKTNEDIDNYSDLARLIKILNTIPATDMHLHLDSVFNTNAYLKVLCLDILTGNWDGYPYNKNNYYLYHNQKSDKFEYIPYDLDNTFGIDWFNINWTTRNIYNWGKTSESRNLFSKVIQNPWYRNRFTYYMRQILQTQFNTNLLFPRIDQIKNMIQTSAIGDTYRTLDYNWTISDFVNSYTTALGAHVKYGLKPFITARITNALSQLEISNTYPIISYVNTNQPRVNQPIYISAMVEDETQNLNVNFYYKINNGSFASLPMYDDGLHNDKLANDKIYGIILPSVALPSTIYYNIQASDSNFQNSIEPFIGYKTINVVNQAPALFINEFMADNVSGLMDANGEFEDWIELYNAGNVNIFLGDKYLSDNFSSPKKWKMPNITIHPNEFLVFFADNTPIQGIMHANFKLESNSEKIGIFDCDSNFNTPIDTISYKDQLPDVSFGRYSNGQNNWYLMNTPTPGLSNVYSGINQNYLSQNLSIFPNPAKESFFIQTRIKESHISKIMIYNIIGQIVDRIEVNNENSYNYKIDKSKMPNGIYIVKVELYSGKIKHEISSKLIVN